MNERLIITILAGVMAIGTHLYLAKKRPNKWQELSATTLLMTGILLLYYHYSIHDPSHGIGILIIPILTVWIAWRRETTGKPAISSGLIIILQVLYAIIFAFLVFMQER